MTKHALPHLRKTKGNIIGAGSAAGVYGEPAATAYGGTKGFLHAFMAGVAVEQAKYGVRANCVCPGPIDTAWTHKETGAVDAAIEKALITAVPFGRRGTPEEVANVRFLLRPIRVTQISIAFHRNQLLADGRVDSIGQ